MQRELTDGFRFKENIRVNSTMAPRYASGLPPRVLVTISSKGTCAPRIVCPTDNRCEDVPAVTGLTVSLVHTVKASVFCARASKSTAPQWLRLRCGDELKRHVHHRHAAAQLKESAAEFFFLKAVFGRWSRKESAVHLPTKPGYCQPLRFPPWLFSCSSWQHVSPRNAASQTCRQQRTAGKHARKGESKQDGGWACQARRCHTQHELQGAVSKLACCLLSPPCTAQCRAHAVWERVGVGVRGGSVGSERRREGWHKATGVARGPG